MSTNIIYLIIASILLLLLFLTFYLWQKQYQKFELHQQKVGINIIFQLRDLFSKLQQHRGLSNGLLKGEVGLQARVNNLAIEINNQIKAIESTSEYENLQDQERWESIVEHWQRFSQSKKQLTPANNLQQHNKLVLGTLYLIDNVAEQFHLHKLIDDHQQSIRHIWLELLFTVENVGQIRALGTGIAAAKTSTHIEETRLNYLSHSLQHSMQHYLTPENTKQANKLVDVINSQLLQRPPAISAEDFFTLATSCIDNIFVTFDRQLRQFEQSNK